MPKSRRVFRNVPFCISEVKISHCILVFVLNENAKSDLKWLLMSHLWIACVITFLMTFFCYLYTEQVDKKEQEDTYFCSRYYFSENVRVNYHKENMLTSTNCYFRF